MLATIFGCEYLALESIQLAIAAVFYFSASKKLVVVYFWNQINFVQSIGIWFRKPPKQPGKLKGRINTRTASQKSQRALAAGSVSTRTPENKGDRERKQHWLRS